MQIMRAQNDCKTDTRLDAFYVTSCGYFYDIRQKTSTDRPEGRQDYQLLCITEGRMQVQLAGKPRVLQKGNVLLFGPGEPQIYGCSEKDASAYFWVHFDGTAVEDILKKSGLYAVDCFQTAATEEGIHLIRKMMAVINRRPPQYQLKVLSYFTDLLARISPQPSVERERSLYAKLSPALSAIEREIHKRYTVEEYAAMCSMSAHYFMHCFKAYTGRTLVQYRDRMAMDYAVYLLEHTSLSVSEVAHMVGMEDSLYFSKKFKKCFGVSPTTYRKSS